MPKILILEDEAILAELLQELLRFEGYEVLAPDRFDGLADVLGDFPADGVILDIHLEDVDGLELIGELRGHAAAKEAYILAISGLDHAQAAKEAGANDFMLKPYMPDELVKMLKENLKG